MQGLSRARIAHIGQTEPYLKAKIEQLDEPIFGEQDLELEALVRTVKEGLDTVVNLGKTISPEVMIIAANLDDPGRLADLAAGNLELKAEDAQEILKTVSPLERLRKVSDLLLREIQLLKMQQEISLQARGEMDKGQREYFLRQQLKAIQQELGEGDELDEEISNFRRTGKEKQMPEEALEELERQIQRLERGHPDSAETAITRTYLEWLTGLPWETQSEDLLDLVRARKVLDEDHYDLEKVKERILEYLAVRKLKDDTKGPILCFVGPPGVGKTSLGRSIARALGREFVRISLGGVRDEAEIRGHRRTYVGAMPGRIIQGINQARTSNPVFMLDEIDKVGADFRGDPSSALLEVLDPEQNFQLSRSLSERRLRPVSGDVHHHRQHAGADSTRFSRSNGGHSPEWIHRPGEVADRATPLDTQAGSTARTQSQPDLLLDGGDSQDRQGLHPGGRVAESRARAGSHLPQSGG